MNWIFALELPPTGLAVYVNCATTGQVLGEGQVDIVALALRRSGENL